MPSIDLGNVMGPQGPQGTIWYQGTAITGTSTTATVFSESEIEDARVYDKYFNTTTNDVYTCIVAGDASTAKWAWIGNLRGAQGNIGPVGPTGSVNMNTPIEFTEAETRANIESGESVSTIFGKLKKVVGDLLAGAASTLLGQKLTASRALVSDANGNVGVSGITSTELGYLDGVTKNIQEQFNEQNVKMIKIMKKTYEISCTTSYASTIGYKGSKNISSDFPSSLIAVIPLGCTQTTDSGRVGNIIYREDGNLYLNMPISCTAHAEVLFLYT